MKSQLETPALLLMPIALLAAIGCGRASDDYRASIRWTSHGIPHIEASDLGSLGYGEGYALAHDHACSLADQVIRARGERSRYFGAGDRDVHLHSDLAMKALRIYERAAADSRKTPPEVQAWYAGYVSGYNRFLEEIGVENLAGWCRGAEWVFPITTDDLAAYFRVVTVTSSNFAGMIATAQPPGVSGVTSAAHTLPTPDRASNGWGLGGDRTVSGRGMLVANPHYPWVGSNRFWEKHLRIPGTLDAYGVGLIGVPGVAIGFNHAVAWTHTVSAGERFTLYSLELVPGNPARYRYDDDEREMEARPVAIEVLQDDGSLETVERTLYFSHYGPILDFPDLGWTEERAITLRDANEDNDEGRLQWLAMNKAQSMDEFQRAHADYSGMPWVNTISTSAEGRAWYADISATPKLSSEALAAWQERTESDRLVGAMWRRGLVLLDGSDSTFEWVDDPDARDPGVVAFEDMPQLERRDYVFNANDSYWLANSSALLTGYSPLHGTEETPRSLRTRMNDTTLSDTTPQGPAGSDGKFDLDELGDAILSNRSLTAELLRGELVARCQKTPRIRLDGTTVDLTEACSVLAEWDGRYDLSSRGAAVFREFIGRYDGGDLRREGKLFAVPFDPADPVGTPHTLAPGPLALQNLARAVKVLEREGIALDTPLGELQFAHRLGDGRRIAIHGGDGSFEGIENFVRQGRNGTTLEPTPLLETVEGSRWLTREGYPVNSGSSFIMALEYTDDGPRAKAFLTYSQSGNTHSEHYWDQTELFSQKQWRPILFSQERIAADVKRELELVGPR